MVGNKELTTRNCWLMTEIVIGEGASGWSEAERRGVLGVFPPNIVEARENSWGMR